MIAVVFPGQGSQKAGMLSAYADFPAVAEAVAEVSDAIGADLATIIEQDSDALNQTINTQPAMLAVGVGVYRASAGFLPAPRCFAGHSLGEYSALVAAGSLSLSDAARLVRRRAELMQNTVADGGMAALLGLDSAAVEDLCRQLRAAGEEVWPANYNSERQIVIAGRQAAITKAVAAAKEAGAKRALALAMNVPSHCPLLAPAAEALLPDLASINWQQPKATVLHSAEVADTGDNAPLIARRLAAQLTQPIHWQQLLAEAAVTGAEMIIESGPGGVLTGLGKKSGTPHRALSDGAALAALAAECA